MGNSRSSLESMEVSDRKSLETTFKGKKIFLTGHTGFKGSWMLYWLYILGAKVKGYALKPENDNDLYYGIQGDKLCHSVIADLRDTEKLEKEIRDFQPDFVFHLAAQPLVRLSYETPAYTFEVNALGTAYVLNAIRKLANPCVVILITTDKVYENKEWIYPYREGDRLGGNDPYSASKACAELIINSYVKSFFSLDDYKVHQKTIGIARAGNVIGGGDWAKDRIIPDIVRSLQCKQSVKVRNPISVRPWQHVLEPIGAYLLLGQQLSERPDWSGEAWNFGPYQEDHLTVEDLVQIAIHAWGEGEYQNLLLKNQPHEASLLKLDISKAVTKLNWKPKLNSREAIAWTIEWYQENKNTISEYTKNQILKYSSL